MSVLLVKSVNRLRRTREMDRLSLGKGEPDLEELGESELGTKEHWDKTYKVELDNYISHGVLSEGWFGEDIEMKITNFLDDCDDVSKEMSVIDAGCGNGTLLLQLARVGFSNLTGVDYSADAVDICQRLLTSHGYINGSFKVLDLISEQDKLGKDYDICLDKGTYDAISLKSSPIPNITPREKYLLSIHHLLKKSGLFILASCNWTSSEICSQTKSLFHLVRIIPTAEFKFGGTVGNVVSVVVLRKL